jgi:GAF domain-containing protein
MKCPRCQQENPAEAKFCLECGTPLAGAAHARPYADLKDENEGLKRSLTAALEHQTATSEILKVISSLPTDLQPTMDAVAESAARLCVSLDALVFVRDGDLLRHVGHHGSISTEATVPLIRGTVNGRAVLDGRMVHVVDLQVEVDEFPEGSEIARRLGHRTVLSVPLMRDGVAIGAIAVRRAEARLFTESQVALLQTFADQAVIAIENVRLFKELQEKNRALTHAHAQVTQALEQQTATAEVLKAISRSTFDLQPVLDTLIENAARLCASQRGVIMRRDGDSYHGVAFYNVSPELTDFIKRHPITPGRHSITARVALERQTIHVADLQADPEYRYALRDADPIRTELGVPIFRGDDIIGVIILHKLEVQPFTDKQIELVETFADQAVIAIENVRLFTELEEKNRALTQAHGQVTEALEQQTATSEILRVISSSHTNLQPVFDAILHSAGRLCDATFGALQLFDGEELTLDGHYGISPEDVAMLQAEVFPMRPDVGSSIGRAIIRRATVHIEDIRSDPQFKVSALQTREGYRTALSVPMLRGGVAVGVINLWRRDVRPFSQTNIDMVQTFADQAVIAIENVRLFTALEARNRELTTALDTQTATSDVLRVISRSQTDVQPVFDTIVTSAGRLCGAESAVVYRFEEEMADAVAFYNVNPDAIDAYHRRFPRRLRDTDYLWRVADGSVLNIADITNDPRTATDNETFRSRDVRSSILVPIVRDEQAIGAIRVSHHDVGAFSEERVRLLKTFAAQAVIAIENVRLFNETKEALERQIATADILRVISAAHTEAQPVFDTIVESAVRLCKAATSAVFLTDGRMLYEPANCGGSPELLAASRARYPRPLDMDTTAGIAVLTRSVVHVPDTEDPSAIEWIRQSGRLVGFRSVVTVPMLREGDAIGAILVTRRESGPFSDTEVDLLKTFTDQAVIAVENVRLFKELEARTEDLTRTVGELRALGEVGQAISSTLDLQTVLRTIVARATQLAGVDAGVIYEYDEHGEVFVPRATERLEAAIVQTLITAPVRRGEGVTGRLADAHEPIQVPDILEAPPESRVRDTLGRAGYRALLAVPLVREDHLLGGLTVFRKTPGEFSSEVIELLRTFATQSALAIQNARLFHEIEDKSRQLEAASQHKSEFLANMSHELRTPLNAIIGFSEVLGERLFGELNEKQEEYLKDIHASGQHLLSLINDILDLSKIEAGRMELELADFHLPQAIDNALVLVRERALRRGITLEQSIDPHLGDIRGDERKVKQVLLNLLSNAIKFTPEGGRIEVRAKPVNGSVEVSVIDTGVGIAPEDQEAIFEEFRQVGTAAKKVEGTGLGLALSRKFIELHGGRIWVDSQVGVGSTFTFTIPVHCGE